MEQPGSNRNGIVTASASQGHEFDPGHTKPPMAQQNSSPNPSYPPVRPQGVLSRPTLCARPSAAVLAAKDSIMKNVVVIETENSELRSENSELSTKIDELRSENERLWKELNCVYLDKERAGAALKDITQKYNKVQQDLQVTTKDLENKLRASSESERQLNDNNVKLREDGVRLSKDLENARDEIVQKEDLMRKLSKELESTRTERDSLRIRAENSSVRSGFGENRDFGKDREMELLYEVQTLNNQKKEWQMEKQDFNKAQKRLEKSIKQLREEIDDRDKEANFEKQRHSLALREYNALLEENNKLKSTLRIKGMNTTSSRSQEVLNTPREPLMTSASSETISTLPSNVNNGNRTMVATGNRVQHPQGPMSTYSSPSASSVAGSSRPLTPLTSREKSQISRSQTFTAPSRQKSQFQGTGTFSIRDSQATGNIGGGRGGVGRPTGANFSGRTASPHAVPATLRTSHSSDSLPSLAQQKPAGSHKPGGGLTGRGRGKAT